MADSEYVPAKTVTQHGEGYIRFTDVQTWLIRNREKKLAGSYTPADRELIAETYNQLIASFGITWLNHDVNHLEHGGEVNTDG